MTNTEKKGAKSAKQGKSPIFYLRTKESNGKYAIREVRLNKLTLPIHNFLITNGYEPIVSSFYGSLWDYMTFEVAGKSEQYNALFSTCRGYSYTIYKTYEDALIADKNKAFASQTNAEAFIDLKPFKLDWNAIKKQVEEHYIVETRDSKCPMDCESSHAIKLSAYMWDGATPRLRSFEYSSLYYDVLAGKVLHGKDNTDQSYMGHYPSMDACAADNKVTFYRFED